MAAEAASKTVLNAIQSQLQLLLGRHLESDCALHLAEDVHEGRWERQSISLFRVSAPLNNPFIN